MKALNSADDLCSIESRPLLGELVVSSEVPEQLSSVEEVHDEVQLFFSLKGIVQVYDEWILNLFENVSLRL
jgi:hypothetical protein